jgi:hypothetical protein
MVFNDVNIIDLALFDENRYIELTQINWSIQFQSVYTININVLVRCHSVFVRALQARRCFRSLVHKIRSAFKSGDDIFEQTARRGGPTKLSDELLTTLNTLCSREMRSSSVHLAAILSEPRS